MSEACTRQESIVFQFTPLHEGRHWLQESGRSLLDFNSRPCMRGDEAITANFTKEAYFNSRPCMRGDRWARALRRSSIFQFTPLHEGRQQNSTKLHLTIYAVCRKSNIIFPYRNPFRLLKKLLWVYAKFAAYRLVCREWLPVPVCKEGSSPLPTNNRKVRYNWEKRRFPAGL